MKFHELPDAKARTARPANKMLRGTADANKSTTGEVDATDAAVELAKEEGIDLATVKGTGTEGRITITDVRDAVAAKGEAAK